MIAVRILFWLLAVPVALLVVVFAVANRHDVRLELWPFPWVLDLPVYLAVLGALLKGMVLGAVIAWAAGHRARRRAREQARRAESLERQLAAEKARSTALLPAAPDQAA